MDVLVNVVNQKLRLATNIRDFVTGTQEFIYFVFDVSDDWKDIGYENIFAQFSQNGVGYNKYLDENYSCDLPSEVTNGKWSLTLYGSNGAVHAATNSIVLSMYDNDMVQDGQSTEITKSLYDQLVERIDTMYLTNQEIDAIIG